MHAIISEFTVHEQTHRQVRSENTTYYKTILHELNFINS